MTEAKPFDWEGVEVGEGEGVKGIGSCGVDERRWRSCIDLGEAAQDLTLLSS